MLKHSKLATAGSTWKCEWGLYVGFGVRATARRGVRQGARSP